MDYFKRRFTTQRNALCFYFLLINNVIGLCNNVTTKKNPYIKENSIMGVSQNVNNRPLSAPYTVIQSRLSAHIEQAFRLREQTTFIP